MGARAGHPRKPARRVLLGLRLRRRRVLPARRAVSLREEGVVVDHFRERERAHASREEREREGKCLLLVVARRRILLELTNSFPPQLLPLFRRGRLPLHSTGQRKNYGFVTFETEEALMRAVSFVFSRMIVSWGQGEGEREKRVESGRRLLLCACGAMGAPASRRAGARSRCRSRGAARENPLSFAPGEQSG